MNAVSLQSRVAFEVKQRNEQDLRALSRLMGYRVHSVFLERLNAFFDSPFLGLETRIFDLHMSQQRFIHRLLAALGLWTPWAAWRVFRLDQAWRKAERNCDVSAAYRHKPLSQARILALAS
jgi:hypothetical protein